MSFKEKIYQIIKMKMQAVASSHDGIDQVMTGIDEYAFDVASSIANEVHLDLVSKIESVTEAHKNVTGKEEELVSALNDFMDSFISWSPVPNDGGAALKAACSSSAGQIVSLASELKGDGGLRQLLEEALEELEEAAEDYV